MIGSVGPFQRQNRDASAPARTGSFALLTPLRLESYAARGAAPGMLHLRTGVGRRSAERVSQRLRHVDVRGCAIAGLCGSLRPDVEPGDVVVASEIWGPKGRRACPSAGLLAAALRSLSIRARLGPILTVDHLVLGEERKKLAASGAIAVDMESAWLADAVGDRPLAVLRVAVDAPGRELFRPSVVFDAGRALRSLRHAVAALQPWADALGARTILLAGPRSFCAGVERAIEIVERALERFGRPLYVRKQIVHNRHVVQDLEQRGAIFVDSLSEVPEGATLVFSAHGVPPEVRREANERGLRVVDATCPLVNKVHAEARRFERDGYDILLIGHAGHEEIEGTTGEAPSRIQLVPDAGTAERVTVRHPDRVAYLTQTTLAVDEVSGIVAKLRRRFPKLVGPAADDICYATQNRQEAVTSVARESDVLIVIGSQNSSNSNRLVEVAERVGCRGVLIDDEVGLDPSWLIGARTVGIAAGASAPESLVQRLVTAIGGLGPVRVIERKVTEESVRFRLPVEVS